jgi:4-hydroxy-tetrahydrodipicolinate synthase
MQVETVLRLAQVPGIIGVKEASGDIVRAAALVRDVPAGFSIYSGNDDSAIALMLLGGHGTVSVTANVAPRAMQALCTAALAGDAREASRLHLQLLRLHLALFVEPSPAPTKWALQRLGRCGAGVRLPILPLGEAGQAVVTAALSEAGLI